MVRNKISLIDRRISFITEGLPWKITVNNCSMQKKNNGKKTLRSRAFPSDSNPDNSPFGDVLWTQLVVSAYGAVRALPLIGMEMEWNGQLDCIMT